MDKKLKNTSRFLSLILRHDPAKGNITLDSNGWTDVEILCTNLDITKQELEEIVSTNDKQRFAFNADKTEIRASQGHSVTDVEIKFEEAVPPTLLYHGTKEQFEKSIRKEGLIKGSRHHVHLSDNKNTATIVADRRKGKSIILEIEAMRMRAEGFKFYKSANGVWLCGVVPPQYIK